MRASTIIILAVCLFSVAFANNKDAGPANSLGPSNSLVGAADESKKLSLETAAAEGEQPKNAKYHKKPRKPRKKPRFPKSPPKPKEPTAL